jgi:Fic family protein
VIFFLEGIQTQFADSIARIQHLKDLHSHYRAPFQGKEAKSARLLRVVDIIFANPLITVHQMGHNLGSNYPTASRYIEELVQAGILQKKNGRTRNRVLQAGKVLNAIEEHLG